MKLVPRILWGMGLDLWIKIIDIIQINRCFATMNIFDTLPLELLDKIFDDVDNYDKQVYEDKYYKINYDNCMREFYIMSRIFRETFYDWAGDCEINIPLEIVPLYYEVFEEELEELKCDYNLVMYELLDGVEFLDALQRIG